MTQSTSNMSSQLTIPRQAYLFHIFRKIMLKDELYLILVIGIIIPILFTPFLIGAVEVDEESFGVVVEFTYPKNLSNVKTDFDDQLTELFASDKPSVIDSALAVKTVVATDTSLITDSTQIELFTTDTPLITDSSLTNTDKIFQVTLTEQLAISEKLELE